MKRKYKKTISWIIILFFSYLTLTINISLPQRAFAEGLAISGLQCKTTEFRPYLEKGQFSYFLNQPASVTAEIQDNDFNLVRKIQFMKMEEAGEHIIMWDGKDKKGNFIKDGEYFLSVSAMSGQGLAVASSIGMKTAFDAPKGIEFKGHMSQLEGREKKQYPDEVPTRFRSTNKFMTCVGLPFGVIVGGAVYIVIVPAVLFMALFKEKKMEFIDMELNPKRIFEEQIIEEERVEGLALVRVSDYKKYEKMKKKVDKHNAKIDAAIAKQNREIDAYNQKIKDSVRIRISLTD